MSTLLDIFVPGDPKPGGSKRAFVIKKTGRAIVTDACAKSKEWKNTVKHFAFETYRGDPSTAPLSLTVIFYRARPTGHFGSGQNDDRVKYSAPKYPVTRPDATKLLRSLEDALTGLVWKDDSQIVEQHVSKRYGARPGAKIVVEEVT